MDFVLGILLAPYAWVGLFLMAIIFDHNDQRGWSGFLTILLFGLIIFALTPSWATVAIVSALWITIGIAYSMWRWSRYCSHKLSDYEKGNISKDHVLRDIKPSDNTSTIIYWVMAWPISMIEMMFSDLIDVIEILVTKVFKETYSKISSNTEDKINAIDNDKK